MNKSSNKNKPFQNWAEFLDAVIAAPQHHRVIFENESVRVLDSRIEPGETVPVHIHRWPSISYVISSDDFVRFDTNGNVILDSRDSQCAIEIGTTHSLPPLDPHSVKNVGEGEIRAIVVEMKNTR